MSQVLAARPALAKQRIQSKPPPAQQVPAKVAPTMPAATSGVSSARSLGGDAQGFAQIIENGFPTQTGVRPRGGSLPSQRRADSPVRCRTP